MILTHRLMKAINRASYLHKDQVRRGKDRTPYASHLYGVMHILSKVTDDEDILIAGLLHDSLEDVPGYTKELLEEEWGIRVRTIVEGVTEPLDANKGEDEQLPWLTRKQSYLQALEQGPVESILVSSADKIHNMMSTEYAVQQGDVVLLENVIAHFRNQKLFYEKIFAIAERKLGSDHMLVQELGVHIQKVEHMLSV